MFHDMNFMSMWWLWLIIIITMVIILVYSVNNHRDGSSSLTNETPLDLLKKSFAKGEIEKQEFEEKKKDLLN